MRVFELYNLMEQKDWRVNEEAEICALCGADAVERGPREQEFVYGAGYEQVVLKAVVPVSECGLCGEAWTGWEAEEFRDAAVREHLRSIGTASTETPSMEISS